VAALKRARNHALTVYLRQDIEYLVVDDEKTSRDRILSLGRISRVTSHPTTKPGLPVPSRAFFRRSGGIEQISVEGLVRHES
jgi:hypothetical protein